MVYMFFVCMGVGGEVKRLKTVKESKSFKAMLKEAIYFGSILDIKGVLVLQRE